MKDKGHPGDCHQCDTAREIGISWERLEEAIRSYWIIKCAVSHKLIYPADILPRNSS